ncbi:hypothetical protein SELMODRAFT_423048 [Selaginella moellendorffii]|uniref:Uncharacterized protein n=1 Tax=Selaginella moellendorffii TaxID=88036 RepID=D8SKE2_SELML|nr:hypothetical protein SELMODRAFT_423048 [Selaginella moellendorffii]
MAALCEESFGSATGTLRLKRRRPSGSCSVVFFKLYFLAAGGARAALVNDSAGRVSTGLVRAVAWPSVSTVRKNFARDVVAALAALHGAGLVHRIWWADVRICKFSFGKPWNFGPLRKSCLNRSSDEEEEGRVTSPALALHGQVALHVSSVLHTRLRLGNPKSSEENPSWQHCNFGDSETELKPSRRQYFILTRAMLRLSKAILPNCALQILEMLRHYDNGFRRRGTLPPLPRILAEEINNNEENHFIVCSKALNIFGREIEESKNKRQNEGKGSALECMKLS